MNALHRIQFVGGKQLSSTGSTEFSDGKAKVYPPTSAASGDTTAESSSTSITTPAAGATDGTNTVTADNDQHDEEPELEPVGKVSFVSNTFPLLLGVIHNYHVRVDGVNIRHMLGWRGLTSGVC